jgi:hypothetical protein
MDLRLDLEFELLLDHRGARAILTFRRCTALTALVDGTVGANDGPAAPMILPLLVPSLKAQGRASPCNFFTAQRRTWGRWR